MKANGGAAETRRLFSARRVAPFAILVFGLVLFFALGLHRYIDCATLREHQAWLHDWVAAHRLLAGLAFMGIYACAVAFSVPTGATFTVVAGLLFGTLTATGMVVVAATLGATVLFLAARTALAEPLRARAGRWLSRLERGFGRDALSYLLILRLIPLFPFFVVNLVPAFLAVPLRTYVIATFFGIIPGTFVYASVGAGLGNFVEVGEGCSLDGVLTTEVVVALVGLAVLATLPIAYRRWAGRRQGSSVE